MLLVSEFSRRPKRRNSLETLGLVSVRYPDLDTIKNVPNEWTALGFQLDDWHSFLKVALDFYVRDNRVLEIPNEWIDWMGAKIYPKNLIRPDSDEATTSRISKWPQIGTGRRHRIIRLLAYVAKLDLTLDPVKDSVNQIMKSAWNAVTQEATILTPISGSLYFTLKREKLAFARCQRAWVCPITNSFIDSTFKGITPYIPDNTDNISLKCQALTIPEYHPDLSQIKSEADRLRTARIWLSTNQQLEKLRGQNLWTDICDRIIEGGTFYRAAEHSAQQPAQKLARYEKSFKEGRVNVLNCSTTMEMGVDIGGISVVAMNNVPPHPANYLQRSGRAGRRGESQALAFTICKDNPHERNVFIDPLWPFKTHIPAPYITLDSKQIVQRHINSLMFAIYLKDIVALQETEVTKLVCEWFFCAEEGKHSPAENMLGWLESMINVGVSGAMEIGIRSLVKNSVLDGVDAKQLLRGVQDALLKPESVTLLYSHGILSVVGERLSKEASENVFGRTFGEF